MLSETFVFILSNAEFNSEQNNITFKSNNESYYIIPNGKRNDGISLSTNEGEDVFAFLLQN
jgi:hypothetical protein